MSRLPRVTGREVIRALERAGFTERRTRGSHHFLVHRDDPTRWATVPIHGGRTLSLDIIRNILRTARISSDELRSLL